MSGLLDALNPLKAVIDTVNGVIGKFVPDPAEKLALQSQIATATAELQSKMIDADRALADAQASVITAEVKSDSWLAKNWRPILMLTFTFIIAWNYIFVPILGVTAAAIPADMWTLMKIGVGGYVIGRSGEKIAPAVASAVTGNGK